MSGRKNVSSPIRGRKPQTSKTNPMLVRSARRPRAADAMPAHPKARPKKMPEIMPTLPGTSSWAYTRMAENAEARMRPISTESATVAPSPTCGRTMENGAMPRMDTQMTIFRPKRSPNGPPRIVPSATEARKTKRRYWAPWIERLNRWMR
jgi:hypothetical protein